MATTVIAAFNEFMKDTVNLKKADTDDARASRDWLIGKMNDFEKDDKFPVSFPAIHIAFGSFARRTKIRPLDDIDLPVCAGPCLRQGKKLEQTEFSLQHHRTAPAFFRYRIQPEPGICRFRVVVFAVGVIWTPGAYL